MSKKCRFLVLLLNVLPVCSATRARVLLFSFYLICCELGGVSPPARALGGGGGATHPARASRGETSPPRVHSEVEIITSAVNRRRSTHWQIHTLTRLHWAHGWRIRDELIHPRWRHRNTTWTLPPKSPPKWPLGPPWLKWSKIDDVITFSSFYWRPSWKTGSARGNWLPIYY